MTLKKSEIRKLNFEDAISQFEKIIEEFEIGEIGLKDLIVKYEEANLLKEHCEKQLSESVLKIEKVLKADNEDIETEIFQ